MKDSEILKLLRSELNLKQGDFARRISTTQGHISDIENNRKPLSDRTKKLICLEFNVRKDFLENGMSPIFEELQIDEAAQAAALLSDDELIKSILISYKRKTEKEKEVLKTFILEIAENIKKER